MLTRRPGRSTLRFEGKGVRNFIGKGGFLNLTEENGNWE